MLEFLNIKSRMQKRKNFIVFTTLIKVNLLFAFKKFFFKFFMILRI